MRYFLKYLKNIAYFLATVISLFFIISCNENENELQSDLWKIPGIYTGKMHWTEDPYSDGGFGVNLEAIVKSNDDHYTIEFSEHDTIHLPILVLEINNTVPADDKTGPVVYFNLVENPSFVSTYVGAHFENSFQIDPYLIWDVASVQLEFRIMSKDPDSVFFLFYGGDK